MVEERLYAAESASGLDVLKDLLECSCFLFCCYRPLSSDGLVLLLLPHLLSATAPEAADVCFAQSCVVLICVTYRRCKSCFYVSEMQGTTVRHAGLGLFVQPYWLLFACKSYCESLTQSASQPTNQPVSRTSPAACGHRWPPRS